MTHGERILLVGRSRPTGPVSREGLETIGFAVDEAGSPEEALACLEASTYAVVILDCATPDADWPPTVRAIRNGATPEGRRRAAIVALTDREEHRPALLNAGADEVASRTADTEAIRRLLQRWAEPSDAPARSAAVSSEAVLDPERVHALSGAERGGGRDLLARLVELFEEDTPGMLAHIRAALGAADAAAVFRAAHQLKGSSSAMGARKMERLAERLERMGAAGDLEGGSSLAAQLTDAYEQTIAMLHAI